MDQSESLWQFMHQQSAKLLQQTVQHIGLTFISLLIAVLIGLPLGIYITRHRRAAGIVLGIAGVLQTIPSIALLGFMIPLARHWPATGDHRTFSLCLTAGHPEYLYGYRRG